MVHFSIRQKKTIAKLFLFQHILEIDHDSENSVMLCRWVKEDWCEGTLHNRVSG